MTRVEQAFLEKFDKATWRTWRFDELVENIVERVVPKESGLKKYFGLEHLDSGSLHISRWGDPQSLDGDKLKIYEGDLIFAKRNAYLKRVAIADCDAVASAHSMVLRAKVGAVNPSFLPFFLLSDYFWSRAIKISVGSLSPTINWRACAKQEFLLPPKDQQAEIAELLWAVDEREQALRALDNVLFKLKSAHVKVAFNKNQGKRVKLRDISISRDNLRVPIKKSERVKGTTPYYGASGVVDHVEGWTHDEPLVLISEDGENLSTRKKPIAMKTDGKVWVNNHIHALSVSVNRYLLVESINSMGIEGYIDDGTRPKLTKASLESIPVVLPVEEDWDYWEALFQQIDTAKGQISRNEETRGLLMKSLLNQLFSDV